MTIIIDLLLQYVTVHKRTRNGISLNCPMCISMGESRNDTRARGGLKINNDGSFMYHCFNCNFATGYDPAGRISNKCIKLLTTVGVPINKIPLKLRLFKQKYNNTKHIETNTNTNILFDEVSLPVGSRTIKNLIESEELNDNFLKVISYLTSRGRHIFNGYNYYWSPDSKLNINKRFIIPFYYKNKIIGWVGRYAAHEMPPNIPKYYGNTPKKYIFNMNILNSEQYDTIILVEGVLDAIAINGIAVLGNDLTEEQIRLLKLSGKRIIVVPDRNKSGKNLVNQAIEHKFEVSIPEWNMNLSGSEDVAAAINNFGLLYTLQTIYQSATIDSNKIITRYKIVSLK